MKEAFYIGISIGFLIGMATSGLLQLIAIRVGL